MDDEPDSPLFDSLIERSLLLESLKDTLDKMVEGSYIRKDTSDSIIKEASRQFRLVLEDNKYLLPKTFIFGQLLQYSYFNKLWILNVKNPLIYVYSDSKNSQGSTAFDFGEAFIPRSRKNLVKDVNRHLNTKNSKMFCYKGCVKIKGVVDSE